MENNSSCDEGKSSRVPPYQVEKLTHELDELENWLVQENQNLNIVSIIEAIRFLTMMTMSFPFFMTFLISMILMISL